MMEILHSQVHWKHLEGVTMIQSVLRLEVSNIVLIRVPLFNFVLGTFTSLFFYQKNHRGGPHGKI